MLAGEMASILSSRGRRPRIGTLIRFLLILGFMVVAYATIFKLLMAREGQEEPDGAGRATLRVEKSALSVWTR